MSNHYTNYYECASVNNECPIRILLLLYVNDYNTLSGIFIYYTKNMIFVFYIPISLNL